MKQFLFLLLLASLASGLRAAEPKEMPAQIDTIVVATTNLETPMTVTVAVPDSYLEPGDTREYPVVYLLNGYGGDYTDYNKKMKLDSLATAHAVILVCPDGRDSWYWDSPVDPALKMETFFVEDLVPTVDARFRTLKTRDQRAITGLSMGGQGAFFLAINHPEIWKNVASMSGGLNITKFKDNWKIKNRLGDYETYPGRWEERAIVNLAPQIEEGLFNIMFSCGTEDFFFEVNNAFDKALTERGIDHVYETAPGGHTWTYWTATLPSQLQFFSRQFNHAGLE